MSTMSDDTKPEPKPKKTLTVRKKRPQRLKVRPAKQDPVDAVHEAVHHVGKAVKACMAVYEIAKPVISAMRKKK